VYNLRKKVVYSQQGLKDLKLVEWPWDRISLSQESNNNVHRRFLAYLICGWYRSFVKDFRNISFQMRTFKEVC